jgi:hypothetical protein
LQLRAGAYIKSTVRQPEAKFKFAICEAYKKVFPDGWHQYNRASMRRGVPDLTFVLPNGATIWLEAKVSPYGMSEVQRRMHAWMSHAGAIVVLVTRYPEKDKIAILRSVRYNVFRTVIESSEHTRLVHMDCLSQASTWEAMATASVLSARGSSTTSEFGS